MQGKILNFLFVSSVFQEEQAKSVVHLLAKCGRKRKGSSKSKEEWIRMMQKVCVLIYSLLLALVLRGNWRRKWSWRRRKWGWRSWRWCFRNERKIPGICLALCTWFFLVVKSGFKRCNKPRRNRMECLGRIMRLPYLGMLFGVFTQWRGISAFGARAQGDQSWISPSFALRSPFHQEMEDQGPHYHRHPFSHGQCDLHSSHHQYSLDCEGEKQRQNSLRKSWAWCSDPLQRRYSVLTQEPVLVRRCLRKLGGWPRYRSSSAWLGQGQSSPSSSALAVGWRQRCLPAERFSQYSLSGKFFRDYTDFQQIIGYCTARCSEYVLPF